MLDIYLIYNMDIYLGYNIFQDRCSMVGFPTYDVH